MKKALIAVVLVAAMSMSCFALSLELVNVFNGMSWYDGNGPVGGVGLGFMAGPVDMTVAVSMVDSSGTTGNIISVKGYYPVYEALRVGLQIDMLPATLMGTARNQMSLLLGVKKTLVSGVDLVLDGIVYGTDGGSPAETTLLNGGATVGLSIAL